jgi:Domain of unknown function (DUF4142)
VTAICRIELSNLAQKSATPDVRRFADRMITDHTKIDSRRAPGLGLPSRACREGGRQTSPPKQSDKGEKPVTWDLLIKNDTVIDGTSAFSLRAGIGEVFDLK